MLLPFYYIVVTRSETVAVEMPSCHALANKWVRAQAVTCSDLHGVAIQVYKGKEVFSRFCKIYVPHLLIPFFSQGAQDTIEDKEGSLSSQQSNKVG